MQVHIGIGGRRKLYGFESLVEEGALLNPFDKGFGNHLARLPMDGVAAKHLRLGGPVLHDLRGELDEVVLHREQAVVGHIAEERMEGMSELVEEGGGFVQVEQGGNIAVRPGKVPHDVYHRNHPFAVLIALVAEGTAPRPRSFSPGTRMEVHIQNTEQAAVGIVHLVGHAFVVVDGEHRRTERDAVEPVAQFEDSLFHIFQREVGPQRLLIEVVPRLTYLLGVIPPVPRREVVAAVLLALEFLHLGELLAGPVQRRHPNLVQQSVDVFGSLGHVVVEHILGVGAVAEQMGPTRTQLHDLVDQPPVVQFVVMVALLDVGGIELLPQVAAGGVGQERQHAGFADIEEILLIAQPRLPRGIAGGAANSRGKSLHLLFAQHHPETGILLQQVFPETESKFRQTAVDLLELGLLFGGEIGSRTHEILIHLLTRRFCNGSRPASSRFSYTFRMRSKSFSLSVMPS